MAQDSCSFNFQDRDATIMEKLNGFETDQESYLQESSSGDDLRPTLAEPPRRRFTRPRVVVACGACVLLATTGAAVGFRYSATLAIMVYGSHGKSTEQSASSESRVTRRADEKLGELDTSSMATSGSSDSHREFFSFSRTSDECHFHVSVDTCIADGSCEWNKDQSVCMLLPGTVRADAV